MSVIGLLRVFVSKTAMAASTFDVWPGFSKLEIGNPG